MIPDATGPRVILVGALGAGRTSVGRALAAALGTSLSETEEVLESSFGQPFSDVVVHTDPQRFRSAVVEAALGQVTGGSPGEVVTLLPSALSAPAVQRALLGFPRLVELRVTPSVLARRAGLNVPQSVNLGQPRAAFARFVKQTQAICEDLGATTVDNTETTPEMTAAEVINRFALQ